MDSKDTLIVTPTLGTRDSLQRTIDSVSKFSYRVQHVLTCPDASVPFLQQKYPDATIASEGTGRGVYAAINHVLLQGASDYKYISYINDDDCWLPGFESLFSLLDNNEELSASYGKSCFIDVKGVYYDDVAFSTRYSAFPRLVAHGVIPFTQQSTLMRSSMYLEMGGFDEKYKLVADTEFWIRAITSGHKFGCSRNLCSQYRIQPGQLSSDTELQKAEHAELRNSHHISKNINTYLELMLFRACNLPLYIRRAFTKFANRSA
jgi:GT2 family glycosyltransferase